MKKRAVESWAPDIAGHLGPAAVRWYDGSEREAEEITARLLEHEDCERPDPGELEELEQNGSFLGSFGDRLPTAPRREHDALRDRLCASIS